MPESDVHDCAIEYLRSLLLAWAARSGRRVKVARNLGIRWVEQEPRAGFDPDLCLIEPPPPDGILTSLRLWEPGHAVPLLAIEIVSPGHPYKDYIDTPERAAAAGIPELWVYDPLLAGPRAHGGPYLLQVWSLCDDDLARQYAGNGPAHSPLLDAWLHPTHSRSAAEARLVITDDIKGQTAWPTEVESLARDVDRSAREAELSAHDAAEQRERVRELEKQLAALRKPSSQ